MKKMLFIASQCLFSCASIAQVTGGIKAGLNVATFIGDDADGSDARVGYNAGAYLILDINDKVNFQPELIFNSLGAKTKESGYDDTLGDYKIDGTLQLTYISLPLMFGLKLNDRFTLQAGPQASFLIAAKAKYDIESDLIETSGSEDVKDQFQGSELGVNLGLGVNFGLVNASVRYCLGLTEVPDDGNIKNSAFQVSLGYKISK